MKFLSLFAILFSFTQCGSAKLEEKPPFHIISATYKNWVGGQPGISGTNVEINLKEPVNVVFDSLFFQKKATKIELRQNQDNSVLLGYFSNSSKIDNDFILHSDSKKELKNTLPEVKKFPFELKENQAVISYKTGNKTYYFKIDTVEKAKPVFYPMQKKQ